MGEGPGDWLYYACARGWVGGVWGWGGVGGGGEWVRWFGCRAGGRGGCE